MISVDTHLSESSQSQESHYQKLNLKTVNRPAVYEDINSVRMQKEMKSSTARNLPRPRGQYKYLQLKSLERPSEYEQLQLKSTPSNEST